MKISRFTAHTSEMEMLTVSITADISKDYVSKSDSMVVVASEQFKFRTNSAQMNMVVIKKQEDTLIVDIIGAAGGVGIFNISLWSESGFVKGIKKRFIAYCEKHDIEWNENE